MAEEAARNGGANSAAMTSSPIRTGIGRPGTATSPITTVLVASQTTMTVRRGNLSATTDSTGPPTTHVR